MKDASSKSTFISKTVIEETLKTPKTQGKRLLAPLKETSIPAGVPFNVLEDVEVENAPEIHRHEADLWQCLEGEVEFVVGGIMQNPRVLRDQDGKENPLEMVGDGIEGGTDHHLTEGDVLYIPAGEPHLHRTKTFARLLIIKVPAKDVAP